MISLNGVTKRYGAGAAAGPCILMDISLSFEKNRFVCILGPSGCGKTTLLNLIAGFIAPSSGSILFRGEPVKQPGPDRAVVFQDSTLFPWMTVLDNVRFGLRRKGCGREQTEAVARECLDLVHMTPHAQAWPVSLSGGMRQRVSIARVLALHPESMLMDEPFSALDANSRERLQDELLRICERRPATVIYVTHNVEEAAFLAERVIIMGPAPGNIRADMMLPSGRPRNRSSRDFYETAALLREQLDRLPCCTAPTQKGDMEICRDTFCG